MNIRALHAADAAAFQRLRLNTLRANPECFCTSLQEAQGQNLADYLQQISDTLKSDQQHLIGAFDERGLLGMVGIERLKGGLRCHRGRIWGLMVDADQRRRGTARQLCGQAIVLARQMGVEKLGLELTGEALAALHLYRSLGFRIEGIEPLALKLDGRYLDEIRMALYF